MAFIEPDSPFLPELAEIRELFGYGVALHSGIAMIGNKGSTQRLDYGVMGDLINSAARIESLTKYYGVPFLITRETYQKILARPPFRLIDTAIPVGKSTAFERLEIQSRLSHRDFETIAQAYEKAFRRYQQGHFAQAREGFEDLAERYRDAPSRVLAHRCAEFLAHPPQEWSGVYHLVSK